jgi:hypothetical protein
MFGADPGDGYTVNWAPVSSWNTNSWYAVLLGISNSATQCFMSVFEYVFPLPRYHGKHESDWGGDMNAVNIGVGSFAVGGLTNIGGTYTYGGMGADTYVDDIIVWDAYVYGDTNRQNYAYQTLLSNRIIEQY